MGRNHFRFVAILFILALAPVTNVSGAEEPKQYFSSANSEYTFFGGYGRSFGSLDTRVQTVEAIARYGTFLTGEMGDGWYRGRPELLGELPLHLAVDPQVRIMTGVNVLSAWKFTALMDKRYLPYLFAGVGFTYVDLGLSGMGTRYNFNYQAGTGIQYFIRKDLAISVEYRFHHISNAGLADPNQQLQTNKFLLGISLFR